MICRSCNTGPNDEHPLDPRLDVFFVRIRDGLPQPQYLCYFCYVMVKELGLDMDQFPFDEHAAKAWLKDHRLDYTVESSHLTYVAAVEKFGKPAQAQ